MRKRLKFSCVLTIVFIIAVLLSINISSKSDKIEKILKTEHYSYLPLEVKNQIRDVYEDSGEIILTEKNKEENRPYLNPDYVDYISLTEEEKKDVSLIPDTYVLDYTYNQSYSLSSDLPSKYDLRYLDGRNYISKIKNQGNLNICWAIASIENAETFLMLQNNAPYNEETTQIFSARQMDYATSSNGLIKEGYATNYVNYPNSDNASRKLNEGGNFFTSSIIMSNGLSLVDESVLPWDEVTTGKHRKDILNYSNSKYEVDSTIQMPTINVDSAPESLINSYNLEVKNYIKLYGAPFIGTYSPESTCGFTNTDGKPVLKTDDCVNANLKLGHAMQIVGWDDDYSYSYCDAGTGHYPLENNTCSKGVKTTGKGAWILRNSWGDETAYKYVYLTYDSTRLSIGFITSMSEMSNRSWDNNYHSNPWIDAKMENGMASVNSQIMEFETNNLGSEKVEKVKFFTSSKQGTYTVSITTDNEIYNDIMTVNPVEAGIYTFDLSQNNIIITDSNFSVKIAGNNGSTFFNNSISVFTSNTTDDYLVTTYSNDAYDSEKPLSNDNPLYIDLPYNSYKDTYSWQTTINTYFKNLPQYAELDYRITKNDRTSTNFSSTEKYYNDMNMEEAHFEGVSNNWSSSFSIREEYGETWNFEVLYEDQIINSFPIKFNTDNKKTKSNVILHSNLEEDATFSTTATDRALSTFTELRGNAEFYNNGYYIESWNTKADGTGISYDADEGALIYHDIELYAQWSDELLNSVVSFECERFNSSCFGFEGSMESVTYKYDDSIIMPINNYTKEGYVFYQWRIDFGNGMVNAYYEQENTDKLLISNFLNYPIFNNEEIKVYAVWIDEYVTINFDSNGGIGSMSGINVEPYAYNGVLQNNILKDNLYTRENYTFIGWNTKADGTGIFYKENSYIQTAENITLYAQWLENKYTITFNSNDGSNSEVNQSIAELIETKLNENTFIREGYTFIGWNTKADGTGDFYSDEDRITVSDDLVLYAQWKSDKYTVMFDANGGMFTEKQSTIIVSDWDDSKLNTMEKPTREGYKFIGFFTAEGTSIESYIAEAGIDREGLIFYAKWEESWSYIINNYSVDESNKYIDNIAINTTLDDFKKNIDLNSGYSIDVDYKTINNKNLLYTGSKTKIYNNDNLVAEYTNIIIGDVSGDGAVNSADLLKMRQHLIGTQKATGVYYLASDITHDNSVNSADLLRLRQHLLGTKPIS